MSVLPAGVGSTPSWARALAAADPLQCFMEVMRAVYQKSSSAADLLPQLGALCAFPAAFCVRASSQLPQAGIRSLCSA